MSESHLELSEVEAILAELERDLLFDGDTERDWIAAEADHVLRAANTAAEKKSLDPWLTFVSSLYDEVGEEKEEIRPVVLGWLGKNCAGEGKSVASTPREVLSDNRWEALKGKGRKGAEIQVPSGPDVGKFLAVTGLQYMLFAHAPGSGVFRGLYQGTNLLPRQVALSVVQSMRVPYGVGTTWDYTFTVWKPDWKGEVRSSADAATERVGRVAAQDFVLGNRWVAGLPLFTTPRMRKRKGALGVDGFLFLTHPIPGAFTEKEGPLLTSFKRVLEKHGPDLAHACREWLLRHLSQRVPRERVSVAGAPDTFVMPRSDMGGLVAGVYGEREVGGRLRIRLGLDEEAFADKMRDSLSTMAMVEPWSKRTIVHAIRKAVEEKEKRPACHYWSPICIPRRTGQTTDHDELERRGTVAGNRHTSFAPLICSRHAQAKLLEGSSRLTLVVPVWPADDGDKLIGTVRINLLERNASGPWADALRKSFDSTLENLRTVTGQVVEVLQGAIDECSANGADQRLETIKRVDDTWHMFGSWLTDVIAEALARGPDDVSADEGGESASDLSALVHILGGFPDSRVGKLKVEELHKLRDKLTGAVRKAWESSSPETSDRPVASLVTWWARSWVPVRTDDAEIKPEELKIEAYEAFKEGKKEGWTVPQEWTGRPLLPVAVSTVPGGLSIQLAGHFAPVEMTTEPDTDPEKTSHEPWSKLFGKKPESVAMLEQAFGFTDEEAHWYVRAVPATEGIIAALGSLPGYKPGEDITKLRSDHELTVDAYRQLTLDQIVARMIEGRVRGEREARSAQASLLTGLAHEAGQFAHFLSPEWSNQPEIQKIAYDYFTLWVTPKFGVGPRSMIGSERRGVVQRMNEVFGYARSAGSLYLFEPDEHNTGLNQAEFAKVQNRITLDLSRFSDKVCYADWLFEGSGQRPIDFLDRGLIASMVNAIKHLVPLYRSTDCVLPLDVRRQDDSTISIANPVLLVDGDPDEISRQANEQIGGSRESIQACLSQIERSGQRLRSEVTMKCYQPNQDSCSDSRWKSEWFCWETALTFRGWSPFQQP